MTTLPERELCPVDGPAVPTDTDREEAARLLAALDEVPTAHRDTSPLPRYGPTPPVPQPGLPPMSQQATEIARVAMFCGLATVPPGLVAIGVMVASEHADPTVIGLVCAAPTALALAVAKLVRSARPEPEVHQHYTGPVTQTTTRTETRGMWAKTINRT